MSLRGALECRHIRTKQASMALWGRRPTCCSRFIKSSAVRGGEVGEMVDPSGRWMVDVWCSEVASALST